MENGNRNKDIQEKKTFANYKNIDIIREGFKKKKKYGNFHTFADPPPLKYGK